MSKKSDLTGMRFGRLTAIKSTNERKNGYTVWICRCDCGNTVHAASRFLKNGWMTSCGCEEKKPRYEDLTGRRFGKLQVLSIAQERDAHGRILWNCVCDCGNTILVPAGQLVNGYRRSCGCLRDIVELRLRLREHNPCACRSAGQRLPAQLRVPEPAAAQRLGRRTIRRTDGDRL